MTSIVKVNNKIVMADEIIEIDPKDVIVVETRDVITKRVIVKSLKDGGRRLAKDLIKIGVVSGYSYGMAEYNTVKYGIKEHARRCSNLIGFMYGI